ncbi:hypothetical protein GGS23DRAFT_616997 [Durotheca rogersii]|uniref:uncharacterized protein n=1 Tax=Durotheca rogersii TaxID=419775 RepID=UPI00222074D8|nr:uncharacterized protein GGS23DRAFT_616997 [Durotheca rogersii]KAI5865880.1 hypothetical protein GGS23DRAFT_616997 [Durotheca rogersii]
MPRSHGSSGSPPPERPPGDNGPPGPRRVFRGLGMSEDEHTHREQRELRFRARFGPTNRGDKDGKPDAATGSKEHAEQGDEATTSADAGGASERKPWETLVVGDLGENLSYIEEKDREIEQQRYILEHYRRSDPGQAPHHEAILDRLQRERAQMADDEENNMPEDQREARRRVGERLEVLGWALATSRCAAEAANIRAAIAGYESGAIAYSDRFTLVYAGRVVDTCASYRAFCADRAARLDRYRARYGPGWLWQEPPLAGPAFGSASAPGGARAAKGLCLGRVAGPRNYHIGHYAVNLRFTAHRAMVMRGPAAPGGGKGGKGEEGSASGGEGPRRLPEEEEGEAEAKETSCHLKTLLDCGATFPILPARDLERLAIDPARYAAQGVMRVQTVTSDVDFRFYEMAVTVCGANGAAPVGAGARAVWPDEPRALGGFFPVQVTPPSASVRGRGRPGPTSYLDRLSGMVPFEACYLSSTPAAHELWLGEDRRDVLGARRMPPHRRFDSAKTLEPACPPELAALRARARTPDQVVFVHDLGRRGSGDDDNDDDGRGRRGGRRRARGPIFTDVDWPRARGKSELAVVLKGPRVEGSTRRRTLTAQKAIVEPRQGGYREGSKPPLVGEDDGDGSEEEAAVTAGEEVDWNDEGEDEDEEDDEQEDDYEGEDEEENDNESVDDDNDSEGDHVPKKRRVEYGGQDEAATA